MRGPARSLYDGTKLIYRSALSGCTTRPTAAPRGLQVSEFRVVVFSKSETHVRREPSNAKIEVNKIAGIFGCVHA